MNKKLTIVCMFLVTVTASAQTSVYHPFPDSSAMWCDYRAFNNTGCLFETKATYELNGQTIINSTVYNRLRHYEYYYEYCTTFSSTDTTTFYIRQDAALKKVWIYVPGTNSDTILYDFNLQVGDTLNQREYWASNFQPPDYWIVSSIDSLLIGGNYRNQFHYSPTFAPTCFSSMIEGIGADHGFLNLPQNCFEYSGQLRKFYQDGMLLYGDSMNTSACHDFNSGVTEIKIKKSVSIFPNPFHSSAQLEFNSGFKNGELKIYNTLGEQVRQQKIISQTTTINRDGFANGIYFYQVISSNGNLRGGKFVIE